MSDLASIAQKASGFGFEKVHDRLTSSVRWAIRCSKCEREASFGWGPTTSPDLMAKNMRLKGWEISAKKRPVCAGCRGIGRNKMEPIVAMQENHAKHNVTGLLAAPPPEMTKDDRRIIFAKLNEVYIDEKIGYDKEWTDHRVASDLNVPLAWVKQIREENFGPEGANEEIRKILAEASGLMLKVSEHASAVSEIKAAGEKLSSRLGELSKKASAITDEQKRIEKNVERALKALGI